MTWRERGVRLLALPGLRAQRRRGTLRAAGLREGAEIRRDRRGVPFVSAADEHDLYFAAGYAQAGDRLWQMDVLRRRAAGRLAEILGPPVLAQDVRARELALVRAARRSEALLSTRHHANLTAFAAGVNAAVRRMRRRGALPVEFLLLRYRPEPWTPVDSLAVVKHLGFDLGRNLGHEVFRARLAREHPEHAGAFTAPKYPEGGAVTVRDGLSAGEGSVSRGGEARFGGQVTPGGQASPDGQASSGVPLPPGSRAWLDVLLDGDRPLGSNAWAVSGARTASGHPLLANDPHIVLTRPSLWYQTGLGLPGENGYGVTVPGIPGLIAGAGRHLAWGITNATVDTQDLCVLPPDASVAWSEESEIVVRGTASVRVRAGGGDRWVEVGPPGTDERRYGLFWSGFEPSAELAACQDMWRAPGHAGFRESLRAFGVPVLNVVVADRHGTIALKTAGNVPRRVPGSSGTVPGTFEQVSRSWEGFLSFDELPETVDPDDGYVVSANHRLLPEGVGPDVGVDWLAPYRAERIEELIGEASGEPDGELIGEGDGAEGPTGVEGLAGVEGRAGVEGPAGVEGSAGVTAADCVRWQSDVLDGRARRILPTLLDALDQAPPTDDRLTAACHRLLAAWDGHAYGHLAAPLVFFRLTQALADHWIGTRLGADLAAAMPDTALQVDHLILTPAARTALGEPDRLPDIVARALTEAAHRIAREQEHGEDPALWRWDRVHRITDQHPLARAVPALFGTPSTPAAGSSHTVALTSAAPSGTVIDGAPWRFVAEVTPTGPHLWDTLRHGASGNPGSPHYDDQTPSHTEGRAHRVPLVPTAPDVLRLRRR
ncbi:penicillin acylase family protein [Streptomyces sp. NPDC004539]|uniref:penicillin acylase family protein n=1 Tax=Streptomyces sp. NPDC004539 TaxID=3154280 RepID=UPI0033A70102